jgi:predicted dehydrogenase
VRFAVIGSGWRSEFHLRMAQAAPDRLQAVGVVTLTAAEGERITARWGVPTFQTIGEVLALDPEVVVAAVSWPAMPGVVRELVAAGEDVYGVKVVTSSLEDVYLETVE